MRYKTDRIPDQPLDMMARAATRIVAPSGDPLADGVLSGIGRITEATVAQLRTRLEHAERWARRA